MCIRDSASVGRIDSKWKSVTEQAGIYAGEEGYDINVGNSTTLEGALILPTLAFILPVGSLNVGLDVYKRQA